MRLLGLAELLIGFSTLPVIFLAQLTDQLWPALGWERLTGLEGMAIKFLISLIVILPPSIAMGTTLPFLLASLFRREATLGRQGIWIYAINTAGGLLGLVAVVSLALPNLGAYGSMCLLASINIARFTMYWTFILGCFPGNITSVGKFKACTTGRRTSANPDITGVLSDSAYWPARYYHGPYVGCPIVLSWSGGGACLRGGFVGDCRSGGFKAVCKRDCGCKAMDDSSTLAGRVGGSGISTLVHDACQFVSFGHLFERIPIFDESCAAGSILFWHLLRSVLSFP